MENPARFRIPLYGNSGSQATRKAECVRRILAWVIVALYCRLKACRRSFRRLPHRPLVRRRPRRSPELLKKAAQRQRWPSAFVSANYGVIGPSPSNSDGTYSATGGVEFPILTGGRIESEITRADILVQQRRAEPADLRGRIDYEVRTALLNLNAARDRVELALSTVDLANRQLTQALDRFAAGGGEQTGGRAGAGNRGGGK
jgi:hypothetical protein